MAESNGPTEIIRNVPLIPLEIPGRPGIKAKIGQSHSIELSRVRSILPVNVTESSQPGPAGCCSL